MADLAHATEGDTDLHGDTDAVHWAERFASKFQAIPHGLRIADLPFPPVDDTQELMLAWFAGAIETGRMSAAPMGSTRDWAGWLRESFDELVAAKFSEDQAMELVGQLVANQGPG